MQEAPAAVPLNPLCLSRDMKRELQRRGYWVVKPFWRTYRDRFADRYFFFTKECGYSRFWSFIGSL